MDADRFDSLARGLSSPTTRRATLGAVVTSGFFSALGLGRAVPETSAAQGGRCQLAFVANVRMGPGVDQMMTPAGRAPGELRGDLSFSLSPTGNLEDGTLRLSDGTSLPVVGQATGHALQMRIELGQRVALVAVGVGEQEVAACRGAIDGVATGPEVGDLGDWHAAVSREATGSSGGGSSPPTPTPTRTSGGCGAGLTRCAGACVDLRSDRNHCGSCGAFCPDMGGLVCAAGICGCPAGWVDCSQAPGVPQGIDGYCADIGTDPGNCGACGASCPAGQTCRNGRCRGTGTAQCAAGLTDCDGTCVDLETNLEHCGACGSVCESGLVGVECRGGVCERADCPVGITYCGAVDLCRDLKSDDDHCGACGNACGPVSPENPSVYTYCENGKCVAPQCPAGTTDCSNYCADLMTSAVHCGVCGKSCAAGETCVNGVCTPPAPPAVCAEQGQPCGAAGCCVGFCGQDETCECVGDGLLCAGTGTGGCCSGQPCNADGYCGTCATLGATCTSDGECCSGQYAAACCFDGVRLASVCTDVTNIGFVCPGVNPAPAACAAGQTDCGGVCVDLLSHAGHCGACFTSCPLGGFCSGGTCQGDVGGAEAVGAWRSAPLAPMAWTSAAAELVSMASAPVRHPGMSAPMAARAAAASATPKVSAHELIEVTRMASVVPVDSGGPMVNLDPRSLTHREC